MVLAHSYRFQRAPYGNNFIARIAFFAAPLFPNNPFQKLVHVQLKTVIHTRSQIIQYIGQFLCMLAINVYAIVQGLAELDAVCQA